jgi:hypothetical protein
MAIEVKNPRRVAVTLSCNRKGGAYQVDKALQFFLEGRGWTLQKVGKTYASMTPPNGGKPPFVFEINIPTRDQVEAVAMEVHADRKPWGDKFGDWIAIYIPPGRSATQRVDPFTGQAISEITPGNITSAVFLVGFRSFWHADVLFDGENADYQESESQPIQLEITKFTSPDEINTNGPLVEGSTCRIIVNAYERNTEARRKCIEAHGANCYICGFSFGVVYGNEAEGYIHVHHVRPLSEIKAEYVVNPVTDLRPVCPNCHAVLHLGGRCRSIDEVRHLLQIQK